VRTRSSLITAIAALAALAGVASVPSIAGDDRPIPAYAATADEALLRPGAGMIDPGGDSGDLPYTELDTFCTWNWVFNEVVEADPDTGKYPTPKAYIGTAAHCTDNVGDRVAALGIDEFGTVVFDSDTYDGQVDFSLVEIDADLVAQVHPQMFGFDAPTGVSTTADVSVGDVVWLHGYGLVLGQNDFTRDRPGLITTISDDEYAAETLWQLGDSGSPITLGETGLALGIVSRYGFDQLPPSTDVGPTVTWILEHLADAGFNVELATID
jgi:hypothetical protein